MSRQADHGGQQREPWYLRWDGLLAIAATFILGLLAILALGTTKENGSAAEAVAALAGAVIGAAGAHVGHKAGRRAPPPPRSMSTTSLARFCKPLEAVLILLAAPLLLVLSLLLAVLTADRSHASPEAVGALLAAVLGVAGAFLLHHLNVLRHGSAVGGVLGAVFVALSLLGGVLLIWKSPWNLPGFVNVSQPVSAEGSAALAAVPIGIGATLFGHWRGAHLAGAPGQEAAAGSPPAEPAPREP